MPRYVNSYYVLIPLILVVIVAVSPLHVLSEGVWGSNWRLFSSNSTGFYPGQVIMHDDSLIIPFSDPVEQYVGVLFINKSTLSLEDYYILSVDWSPLVFKSLVVGDKVFVVDRRGMIFTIDLGARKITGVYMVVNASRDMGAFITDAAVDEEGNIYVVSWGGRYYSYSTISKFKWNGSGFEKIWSSEVDVWNLPGNILVHDGRLFFVTSRGVYVFDTVKGEITAARRFIVQDPYKPGNFTIWWDDKGLNLLVYLHNESMITNKYDLTLHLVLNGDLDKLSEHLIRWADNNKPAILCYFQYIDYPYVSGGGSPACRSPARIIDVKRWITGWFVLKYYMPDKEIMLRTFTASATYDDQHLYIAVRASTYKENTLLVFKAPLDLRETDNKTLLGDIMTVYNFKLEPTNYITLAGETARANHLDYIEIERLLEKHYRKENIRIEEYQTLNPKVTETAEPTMKTNSTHTTIQLKTSTSYQSLLENTTATLNTTTSTQTPAVEQGVEGYPDKTLYIAVAIVIIILAGAIIGILKRR